MVSVHSGMRFRFLPPGSSSRFESVLSFPSGPSSLSKLILFIILLGIEVILCFIVGDLFTLVRGEGGGVLFALVSGEGGKIRVPSVADSSAL